MYTKHAWHVATAALICAAPFGLAHSASAPAAFPTKPITIIVGYAAGGGNDVLARVVGERMAANMGQPVIIENRPGVASIIGANVVAKAKPDGYTLLWGASGPISFNPALYSKLSYKPEDFTPVSLAATFPLVLLTQANNPAKTVKELVDFSIKSPEKANYGASAASFQLVSELFNSKTGGKFTRIPYKGSNESVSAVMAGDVTMTLVDPGPASTALQGNRAKALAVTSAERMADYPNVPTLTELGIDLKVELWSGVLAPAGTPEPIIRKLEQEIARAVGDPEVKKRIQALGMIPTSNTSAEFTKIIQEEVPLWKKVAKENNISAD
ncbi:Bug family tripartite tricarboxylate transporter substrate binding protein [Pigmentiphaga litoralis]|uniref:Tripartite-type tricarboxylate transporter receptor subunit TctC n=1 Tax=Pigmentiphaga litoralis TaxID=516702 RepID=A0A7Y9LPX5_9BURK|nr:tripartite tricarboxylate transporter substrate binding protein [Pigmentiphaga litoralis]NYE26033.1 tripartite-type tricarboxylate transporter receptor subunit TctC [Pigmentiphaga litoralis]NYE85153.1 tripartite-type tricarboxylate transporter receptor subunit TctC [Pigmentiphaga litoralis]